MILSNIYFKYANNEKVILKDVSLTLEKGKTYALIGPTGEGKSTLALIIAGILKPIKGSVTLNDLDLNHYTRTELSDYIGVILQEPFLYEGTILDNIVFGNPKLVEYINLQNDQNNDKIEKFTNLLQEKGLHKLIDLFEDGLNTIVTNNSENISLGQKQIINFLRTILREPKILIMDEATANLDTVTEDLLEDILSKLNPETTKVIIAHRMNTVKKADYKYQVVGGKVDLIK